MKLLPLLRGSPFALPLAALTALAMLLISEGSYQRATGTFAQLGRQDEARREIQTLWRSLTDAETGQRGYLLTGRKEYLKPYLAAQGDVAHSLDWLNEYYGAEPATRPLVEKINRAASAKLGELAATNRLYDDGKEEAWRELVLSNIGAEQMDEVRDYSAQLLSLEDAKAAESRDSVSRNLLLNRIGVAAMTALSFLALYMYLRQTTALASAREEQRHLVQVERDQFARELLLRTGQLTELARHLQTVREDERHRLARELHDELGALLTAAKLDVARLKSRLGAVTPEVAERLVHLSDGLNSGIALKRRIIEDLRPSSLSNLGLVAALDILVREWSQRSDVEVDSKLEPVRLRATGDLTVYRLVQEALTNVTKYARATRVEVRLAAIDGQVRVSVHDDGVGFDVNAPGESAHGLLGMRYRLETEGGELSILSSQGNGTRIEATLPESHEPVASAHSAAVF